MGIKGRLLLSSQGLGKFLLDFPVIKAFLALSSRDLLVLCVPHSCPDPLASPLPLALLHFDFAASALLLTAPPALISGGHAVHNSVQL